MRKWSWFSLILFTVALVLAVGLMAGETGPEKLVFKTKMKDVVFNHAAHVKAAKGDCKVCHDKLWPQSSKAPLNYNDKAMHKVAEKNRTACAACHAPGGTSFGSVGNCNKCHGNK